MYWAFSIAVFVSWRSFFAHRDAKPTNSPAEIGGFIRARNGFFVPVCCEKDFVKMSNGSSS